jgi:hypothetical protein
VARERERLAADLMRALDAHALRLAAAHRNCRPDTFLLCFRDYYLLKVGAREITRVLDVCSA